MKIKYFLLILLLNFISEITRAQQLVSFDSVYTFIIKSRTADGVDTSLMNIALESANTLKINQSQFNQINEEALKFKNIENDDYYFAIKTLAFLTYLKPENYLFEIEFGEKLIDEIGENRSKVKQDCYHILLANLRLPFRNTAKLSEGFEYYSNCLTVALHKNDSATVSICYYVLGGFNFSIGLNNNAIYNTKKAIAYINSFRFESNPLFGGLYLGKQGYINHTGVLGFYYTYTGDYKQSLKYSYSAIDSIYKYFDRVGRLRNVSFINNNIAVAKIALGELNDVRPVIDSAIIIALRVNSKDQIAQTNQLLGIYFLKLNQIDSAVFYFNKCLNFKNTNKLPANGTSGVLTPSYYLSLIKAKQNHYDEAIQLLIAELPDISNLRMERLRDLELLADVYEKAGNHKLSVETFQTYIQIQKQLRSDEQKYQNINYENEAKIAASEKEMKAALLDKQFATQSRNYLFGIVVLILIIAVGLLNRYLSKNKDNKKLHTALNELEIEASLERVRSVAMGMQQPNDMLNVCKMISEQLQKLGVTEIRNVQTAIIYENKHTYMNYEFYAKHDKRLVTEVDYKSHQLQETFVNEMLKGSGEFFASTLKSDEVKEWYAHQKTTNQFADTYLETAQSLSYYWFSLGAIALGISTYVPLTEKDIEVFRRFRNVFELAYRRYSDIEKANAMAREAQIEASLEKVRAVAMSMNKSEDLLNVSETLYKEVISLGFAEVRNAMINIYDNENSTFLNYDYSDEIGKSINHLHYNIHPLIEKQVQQIRSANDAFSETFFTGKDLETMIAFRKSIGEKDDPRINNASGLYYYFYSIGIGSIGISTFNKIDEQKLAVLKRFRNVFSLAYQRYSDITLAEAQAYESKIEAALERVRSRTLAMQKSDELAETAAVAFKQLIQLGIEPNRLYISIVHDEDAKAEFWITDEDGSKVSELFNADMYSNETFRKMFEGWKAKKKSIVIDMQGDELKQYFEQLSALHVPFKGGLTQTRRVQNIAYFTHGFIGIASPEPQTDSTTILLERFAYVLNLTFTRFHDLKIAEQHALQAEEDLQKLINEKKRTEEALAELKSTQQQLVQSEKLASLGALTAGIAHEIKNPLNFVNNFSELSNDLIDEFLEAKNETERKEIAGDLKLNLQKINEHGKRADSIVKNMLEHSRAGSGEKQLTDINKICVEYFNLAYHGKRASNQNFNCQMILNLDKNLPEVNCVAQEISRVILNLFNNAFDELKERQDGIVSITTQKSGDIVLIKIKDNGRGIPHHIKEKIFEPFFTTKPAGQGTGLGLSLSYDIIKAHGGKIEVSSKENEGTDFIIMLPV